MPGRSRRRSSRRLTIVTRTWAEREGPAINHLVFWNIDLTLLDVARVSRDAYAEAFRKVTGRPLVALPQLAGASDTEIFHDALALNGGPLAADRRADDELVGGYLTALAAAFAARGDLLASQGRVLPGAREALAAVAAMPGVVQTVLTGSIRPNATAKLAAFGLGEYLDVSIGGFGSDACPKGTQIVRSLSLAAERYQRPFTAAKAVYLADSARDMTAGRIGGVRAVGVASGRTTVSELRQAGAVTVLRDLTDARAVQAAVRGPDLAAGAPRAPGSPS